MSQRISKFEIKGFKSIQNATISPGDVNIFIGPNGSGKSNLIAFFRMLSWMVKSVDRFQEHLGNLGFASAILFDGPGISPELSGLVELETSAGHNEYYFRLARSGQDQLFFAEEKVRYSDPQQGAKNPRWTDLGFGHTDSNLEKRASSNKTVRTITTMLKGIFVYQFHNTAQEAPIRSSWSSNDGRWLKENASNLGSFLLNMQEHNSDFYVRIVRYIQRILPFFDTFELEDRAGRVLLQWREKQSDQIFFAGQASDGMLRAIALIALLAQPPRDLPAIMFIDEPELGLHPAAITLIAALIKKASQHCQVFVATQSVNLIDEFEVDQIVVVERKQRASTFTRQNQDSLSTWLEEFSIGELWEKNVIGGRP
jgi:predicted ATPase